MDEENEMTLLASEVIDDANWEVWYKVHYSCYCKFENEGIFALLKSKLW